jgi:hypothetical protein
MEKSVNKHGKDVYSGVTLDSPFTSCLFHEVAMEMSENIQFALHTNLGSITVLDRMTGYEYRDIETGFRDVDGKFWLASGNLDVRKSGVKTIGEAIEWIKKNANTCKGI